MICLTEQRLREQVALPGSSVSIDENMYPYFTDPGADCFSLDIPPQGSALPSLARAFSLLEAEDETYFHGAFLWYGLWNIGSPQVDRIGWVIVEKMRLGYGEARPLEAAPVHRFREDESTPLQAFLLQAMAFQWDVSLLHNTFDRLVHVSHDGYAAVATSTGEARERCWSLLEARNPRPASDRVRSMFIRPQASAVR
jgi:hypothetical protein